MSQWQILKDTNKSEDTKDIVATQLKVNRVHIFMEFFYEGTTMFNLNRWKQRQATLLKLT